MTHADEYSPTPPVTVEIDGATYECHIDEWMLPAVVRTLAGRTDHDCSVDRLPLPVGSLWRTLSVRALRWYRSRLGSRLGHRCVLDPSCSRYAELAVRSYGPSVAGALTLRRLLRCKPGVGGVDFPPVSSQASR